MELRQANKEGTGIKKHGRGGSMACPVLFRRYLILLKSPGRVWEAHLKISQLNPMAFTRRIFTKEFRLNAAKLVVDEHRPAVDVARELDINPKSLYSWVRQYRSGLLQASLDGEDSVSAEQAEIARLRSELQKSRAEVLLLKKFAAYLSKNGLQ